MYINSQGIKLFALLISFCCFSSKKADFELIVKEQNAKSDKTWTAWLDPRINYDDNAGLLKKIGTILESGANLNKKIKEVESGQVVSGVVAAVLPTAFDLRAAYPNCGSIPFVRDQSQCGSCWAFSAATVASDYYCIQKGISRSFSPNNLLACCSVCYGTVGDGCQGGYMDRAFNFLRDTGVTTGELYGDASLCQPYFLAPTATVSAKSPACASTCAVPAVLYDKVKILSYKSVYGETNMMNALVNNGSLSSAFDVYYDFYAYKSGVYISNKRNKQGGHAIRIIGYGVLNNVKYWLIVNSWGNTWGESGLFKMRKGKNDCNIEAYYSFVPSFV